MREGRRFLWLMIFMLGVIGLFIFYEAWPLMTGETVVLATRPVDPFDIFRGQYLVIAYDVGDVPLPEGASVGDAIYVSLIKAGDVWEYGTATLARPEGTFIRGTIDHVSGGRAIVRYGIEQYFFERDAQINTQNMTVEVRISRDGRPKIARLLSNGKPMQIQYQNASLRS